MPKKPAPPGGWPAAAGRSGSGGFDELQQQEQQAAAPAAAAATTAAGAGSLFAGLLGRGRAPIRPVTSSSNASSNDSNSTAPSSPPSSTTTSVLHVRRAVPPPPTSAGDALALDAALARAHAAVLAAAEIDATLSGSTAVTLALGPSGLAIAHVGDSRALLGRVLYEEAQEEEEEEDAETMETEGGGENARNAAASNSNDDDDSGLSSEGADGMNPLQSASSGADTAKGAGSGDGSGSAGSGDDEGELCGCGGGGGALQGGVGPSPASNGEAHQQHVAARLAAADRRRKQHEKLLPRPPLSSSHGGGSGRRNSNASSTCAFAPSSSRKQQRKPSKAILLPALALTSDHVPTRPDEASRIYAHRGRIGAYSDNGVPVGPLRVWLPSVDAPGLCMTRAVGDAVGALAGVSARAEVSARPLSRRDRYLVLVSDGVHEFSTNDDIMSTVHRVAVSGGGPAEAAAALVAAAKLQWIAEEWGASDDCTAVVAFLEDDDGEA